MDKLLLVKGIKYLIVGSLWGITNPLIKNGSKNDTQKTNSLLETLINLISTPRQFIPMIINQLGSVMFYYLLSTEDLSTSVIICNSLTFCFTGITAWYLGEVIHSPIKLIIGIIFVMFGIALCMYSKNKI
jgi:hypothetical protein